MNRLVLLWGRAMDALVVRPAERWRDTRAAREGKGEELRAQASAFAQEVEVFRAQVSRDSIRLATSSDKT